MSEDINILLDECVPIAVCELLKMLFGWNKETKVEIRHIIDFKIEGKWDEDWVPLIADGSWIVISGDKGENEKGKGESLPRVCERYEITHVIMSGKLHSKNRFVKACAIIQTIERVLELSKAARGGAYLLRLGNPGPARLEKKISFLRCRPSRITTTD